MNFFQNIGFTFGKNNKKYIEDELRKTNNSDYIKELIEKANPDIIDYKLLYYAMTKGYKINENTPVPKNFDGSDIYSYPDILIKFAIEKDPNMTLNFLVDAVQEGKYSINENTPYPKEGNIKDLLEQIEQSYLNDSNYYTTGQLHNMNISALQFIIDNLDSSKVTYDILKSAVRLGYQVSEKTPVPRFATSDDLKSFIESYTPITEEEAYSEKLSYRQQKILKNEYLRSNDVIKNIIDKNKDVVTYEILDLAYAKVKWLYSNVAPKVETKDQVINILNSYNQIETINTLIDNLPKDIMDDEILHKAIDKGYVIHYETPGYLRNNEELIKTSKEDVKVRMLKAICELPNRYGNSYRYGTYRSKIDDIIRWSSKDIIDDEIFRLALYSGLSMDDEFIKRKFGDNADEYIDMKKYYHEIFSSESYYFNKKLFDLFKIDGSYLSNKSNDELNNLCKNAIDKEYKITYDSPRFIRKFEYLKHAFEKGQKDCLKYLNDENLSEENIKWLIDNGYLITGNSPKIMKQLDFIQYAIEKGQKQEELATILKELYDKAENPDELNKLDNLLYKMIDNGCQFTYNEQLVNKIEFIKYRMLKNKINSYVADHFVRYYGSASSEEKQQLDKFIFKLIDEGREVYKETTYYLFCNIKYILYAMEHGQSNALNYLDTRNLKEEEKQQILDLMKNVINNGYRYTDKSPYFICDFENIKYAIEKGQGNARLLKK